MGSWRLWQQNQASEGKKGWEQVPVWRSAHFLRREVADETRRALGQRRAACRVQGHLQLLTLMSRGERLAVERWDFPSRLSPGTPPVPRCSAMLERASAPDARSEASLSGSGQLCCSPPALRRGNSLPVLFPKTDRHSSQGKGCVSPNPGPFSHLSQGLQVEIKTVSANESLRMRECSAGVEVG